jgi:sugar (pentulose or hexulose) kinase
MVPSALIVGCWCCLGSRTEKASESTGIARKISIAPLIADQAYALIGSGPLVENTGICVTVVHGGVLSATYRED